MIGPDALVITSSSFLDVVKPKRDLGEVGTAIIYAERAARG